MTTFESCVDLVLSFDISALLDNTECISLLISKLLGYLYLSLICFFSYPQDCDICVLCEDSSNSKNEEGSECTRDVSVDVSIGSCRVRLMFIRLKKIKIYDQCFLRYLGWITVFYMGREYCDWCTKY